MYRDGGLDPNWTCKVIVWLLHAWLSGRETGAAVGGLPSLSLPEHRSARGSEVTCSFARLGHPPCEGGLVLCVSSLPQRLHRDQPGCGSRKYVPSLNVVSMGVQPERRLENLHKSVSLLVW